MDILNGIYDWHIGIEQNDKFKTVVSFIKSPRNTVLHICSYKDWVYYVYLGTTHSTTRSNTNGQTIVLWIETTATFTTGYFPW